MVGLGGVRLAWVGLGCVGLVRVRLGGIVLRWVGLGWVGAGLGWA